VTSADGGRMFPRVEPPPAPASKVRQMPASGSGVIGGTGRAAAPLDARVVVTSQLIYVLDHDQKMVESIVRILSEQDYIGGIFVDDRFGTVPGALPMSAVELVGATAKVPRPSIVVSYTGFATDPKDPLMTGVIVGGGQQEGQGNHGSLTRPNTFNNMAAIGPDFKRGYVDAAPIGNVDLTPTLASILGITLPKEGTLRGRVLKEALAGGPASVSHSSKVLRSRPAGNGRLTTLKYQDANGVRYLDEAEFK
jgi:hypothetical protein